MRFFFSIYEMKKLFNLTKIYIKLKVYFTPKRYIYDRKAILFNKNIYISSKVICFINTMYQFLNYNIMFGAFYFANKK